MKKLCRRLTYGLSFCLVAMILFAQAINLDSYEDQIKYRDDIRNSWANNEYSHVVELSTEYREKYDKDETVEMYYSLAKEALKNSPEKDRIHVQAKPEEIKVTDSVDSDVASQETFDTNGPSVSEQSMDESFDNEVEEDNSIAPAGTHTQSASKTHSSIAIGSLFIILGLIILVLAILALVIKLIFFRKKAPVDTLPQSKPSQAAHSPAVESLADAAVEKEKVSLEGLQPKATESVATPDLTVTTDNLLIDDQNEAPENEAMVSLGLAEEIEPAASEEPEAESFAPSGISEEPDADSFAPSGISAEPDADSFAPVGISEEPAADSFAPVGIPEEPEAGSFAPVGISEEPEAGSFAPVGIGDNIEVDRDEGLDLEVPEMIDPMIDFSAGITLPENKEASNGLSIQLDDEIEELAKSDDLTVDLSLEDGNTNLIDSMSADSITLDSGDSDFSAGLNIDVVPETESLKASSSETVLEEPVIGISMQDEMGLSEGLSDELPVEKTPLLETLEKASDSKLKEESNAFEEDDEDEITFQLNAEEDIVHKDLDDSVALPEEQSKTADSELSEKNQKLRDYAQKNLQVALEKEEWKKVIRYCRMILSVDPTNAEAKTHLEEAQNK